MGCSQMTKIPGACSMAWTGRQTSTPSSRKRMYMVCCCICVPLAAGVRCSLIFCHCHALQEGHAAFNELSLVASQESVREIDQELHGKRGLSCGGNLVVAVENVQRHDQVPRVVRPGVPPVGRAAVIHQNPS